MDIEAIRDEMNEKWVELDASAMGSKNSQAAVFDFEQYFKAIKPELKGKAEVVLSEWVFSQEERKRFDALWLIDRFEVGIAIPNLKNLAESLCNEGGPTAIYEKEKVDRLIEKLTRVF